MKNKNKGFTFTELIIVIVIIAILAAIMIPSYTGYVKKAKYTVDTTLVKQLNDALIDAENDPIYSHNTLSEVAVLLTDYGFILANLQAKSENNTLVWNQDTNRFYILKDDGTIESRDENSVPTIDAKDAYKYWLLYYNDNKFVTIENNQVKSDYSVYLVESNIKGILTTDTGLDTSDANGISCVVYDNKNNINHDVTLNTHDINLIVDDASEGSINHYGNSYRIIINQSPSKGYIENGTVTTLDISKGTLELGTSSLVDYIYIEHAQTLVEYAGTAKDRAFTQDVTLVLNGKDVTICRNYMGSELDEPILLCNIKNNSNNNEYIWLCNDGTIENGNVYTMTTSAKPDFSVNSTITLDNASKEVKSLANYLNEDLVVDNGLLLYDIEASVYEEKIRLNADTRCSYSYENGTEDNTIIITNITLPTDFTGYIVISETIDGKTVVGIKGSTSKNVFNGQDNIKDVVLPNTLKSIGEYAFNHTSLYHLIIPKSVEIIDNYAFYKCYALEYINIPENVTSIGNYAFGRNYSLQYVYISSTKLISIGEEAFVDCNSLSEFYYAGTMAQWNTITKVNWQYKVKGYSLYFTFVRCYDGDLTLE